MKLRRRTIDWRLPEPRRRRLLLLLTLLRVGIWVRGLVVGLWMRWLLLKLEVEAWREEGRRLTVERGRLRKLSRTTVRNSAWREPGR